MHGNSKQPLNNRSHSRCSTRLSLLRRRSARLVRTQPSAQSSLLSGRDLAQVKWSLNLYPTEQVPSTVLLCGGNKGPGQCGGSFLGHRGLNSDNRSGIFGKKLAPTRIEPATIDILTTPITNCATTLAPGVPLLCGCLTSHKPFASCHQAKKEQQKKNEGHSKRKQDLW